MNRKMVLIVGLIGIALASVYQIRRYVDNRQRNDFLNAVYQKELAKLDSIGGLITPTPTGGSRVILPVKSLTVKWLTDTEDSMLLTLAANIVICGDAKSPVVSKVKAMKWYDLNKVDFSSSCP